MRSENGIFVSGIGNSLQSVHNGIGWLGYVISQHPSTDYKPSYGIYGHCVNSTVDTIRLQDVKNINITNMNVTFINIDKQSFWDEI